MEQPPEDTLRRRALPEAASALGITSIPTVLVIKGGEVVQALVGVQNKSKYVDALNKL